MPLTKAGAGALAALAVCALLALAETATAKIQPQRGIAGIKLGMTVAEVIEKKGEPDRDRVVTHEIIGEVRKLTYGKTWALFAGTGDAADAIAIRTRSRGRRTPEGAGVGTRAERLRELHPGVRCRAEGRFSHCFLGRFRPGKRVTDFRLSPKTDRVKAVTVAIVID